jgi:hypothetical protein
METTNKFLKTALDKAMTYTTPDKVLQWVKVQSLIGNPPWKRKDLLERIMFITERIYCISNDHIEKFNPNDFTYNIQDDYIYVLENNFFNRIYYKIPIENLALDNEALIWRIIYPKRELIVK